ncbi:MULTISPECIES: amidohydrolase [unclassified Caulobacter]|uniref:amidohydrolase n=1 Tax=unclassified Caulobacter TaxID=2648921 RepID=UPI000D3AA916|nr:MULTISPECIES: amidohydrolase [unclassified Caulobacter]PTS91166.1 amidohydrolase [Caulobacter sp. HMWF009]PTT11905.1 amidohydrolase [Caulobacter sp. HMWF025]
MRRIILAALLAATSLTTARAGDLLIHGGPIHTGVESAPGAEAVLIRDRTILFVGDLKTAKSKAAKDARDVDLKGATAFPGFVDAHAHLTGIGLREMTLNLDTTASVAELVAAVKAYAQAHPDGAIFGRGWIETHWPEKRFPNRIDLDAAAPGRVIVLQRADGHAMVASSAALAAAGVTAMTPDPEGGKILKGPDGGPDGMMIDHAQSLVRNVIPPPSDATRREALKKAGALYAARGWTGLGNMSVDAGDLKLLTALAAEKAFSLRVDNYMDPSGAAEVLARGPFEDSTGLIRTRGIKLYMDGALGSRGAALLEPYSDAEGLGLQLTERDKGLALMKAARAVKAQVAMHAIGDRGNRMTLDWFGETLAGDTTARWRIEHAQIVADSDLPRFSKMGVIASMQPSHAIGDLYFAPARLGQARLHEGYRWNDMLKSGAIVAAGSDAPVEVGDPRIEFYAAVYRHSLDGFANADWHLDEAVSRTQALKMLTLAPAYAAFAEGSRGTLEAGKKADVTVFDRDLMIVPPAEILKAQTVLTVVDGVVVFER